MDEDLQAAQPDSKVLGILGSALQDLELRVKQIAFRVQAKGTTEWRPGFVVCVRAC